MSLQTQAATDGETRSKEQKIVADILSQSTTEDLTRDKLVEQMTAQGVSNATQQEILAKLGLINVNIIVNSCNYKCYRCFYKIC